MSDSLVQKYNVPGPRYTSYPTVPYWDLSSFSTEKWQQHAAAAFANSNQSEGISLYIHLPFCESLCTFCACNRVITRKHSVEDDYIDTVLAEFALYRQLFGARPRVKELHLGGGTPTFFSPDNLQKLIEGIFQIADVAPEHEFSIEGHPNNTTLAHLKTLHQLGFKRISFGVQDYDLKVQHAIRRIQPFEHVAKVTHWAREVGFESVSHDLVFGLPFQTVASLLNNIDKTQQLMPDRIALYSYAHVPWIKEVGQRGFYDEDLPSAAVKRAMYQQGKQKLLDIGYDELGMDHFALPSDSLFKAARDKKMHRNFMGYSASKTQLMIGLGVSSISDSWTAFAQNCKSIADYQTQIKSGKLAVVKGHILTPEDLIIRRHILNIMCQLETSLQNPNMQFKEQNEVIGRLDEMARDQLLKIENQKIMVTEKGRTFSRNICMAFDLRMLRNLPQSRIFSMTI